MSESSILAAFTVNATTVAEFSLDVGGMTDKQLIAAAEFAAGDYLDTSVCHQCGHNISDPEPGEMVGLTVDGREIDLDGPSR